MNHRSILRAALPLFAAAVFAFGARPCDAAGKHMLVVTHTTGFRHGDSIPVAEGIIQRLATDGGEFDVDFARNADDVTKMMTADALKKYDAVFFCQTTGDLGLPDKQAFLDFIKAGHGFIGTHSATDTYHNWPDYVDLIGGEFKGHGAQRDVEVHNEDPTHPATQWLPQTFKVFDEIYEFKPESNSREKTHVLLSMTHLYPVDPAHPEDSKSKAGDYWTSWCRSYGTGRVFYTALGHRPEVWKQLWYQQHLLGGIRWALGLAPGSSKPSGPLVATNINPVPVLPAITK